MSAAAGPRVLFVDDDPNILDSFRRTYRNHLDFDTAESAPAALLKLDEAGPFAVVVSDQRMPQMSGIQLLKEIRTRCPDTIRIMLTGNADQQTAIEAVNMGHIFRFLTKPCPPATLLNAVQDGIRLWMNRNTEREILAGTLAGSLRILTDVLGILHPASYGQNQRVQRMVKHVATVLKLPDAWQYETAAMLSQIGCVALDAGLLTRVNAGYTLAGEEDVLFRSHPDLGARLIRNLPRMEAVADMINLQMSTLGNRQGLDLADLTPAEIGGHLLGIALRVDQAMRRGKPYQEAVSDLIRDTRDLRQDMLSALQSLRLEDATLKSRPIRLKHLHVGHTLADDVLTETGVMLASRDQEITDTMLERIRGFAQSIGIREPMLIWEPMLETEPGQ
ncbi:MAG: response regulator [Candidatus Delongbacteria bacterium]